MPNPQLTKEQCAKADELLERLRADLDTLAAGDALLLFAYRRRVAKMLNYDERGGTNERRRLKATKRAEQRGLCATCPKPLPPTHNVLDRLAAVRGIAPGGVVGTLPQELQAQAQAQAFEAAGQQAIADTRQAASMAPQEAAEAATMAGLQGRTRHAGGRGHWRRPAGRGGKPSGGRAPGTAGRRQPGRPGAGAGLVAGRGP